MGFLGAFKAGYREATTGGPDVEYQAEQAARDARLAVLRDRMHAATEQRRQAWASVRGRDEIDGQ
jgi:hypothetical protein